MTWIAILLIALVAFSHFGFMVIEMFFWTTPFAQGRFGTTAEFAEASKALAANQGLYNGFLAAGLAWSLISGRQDVAIFFLACVIVAGIFGAATVKPRILFVQALPAALALAAVLFS